MIFAGDHLNPGQRPINFAPVRREPEHPPQDFQLPIDAGNGKPSLSQSGHEPANLVRGGRAARRLALFYSSS